MVGEVPELRAGRRVPASHGNGSWKLYPCQEGSSSPDMPRVEQILVCSKSHSAPPRSLSLLQPTSLQPFPGKDEFRTTFIPLLPSPGMLECPRAGDTACPHLAQHPGAPAVPSLGRSPTRPHPGRAPGSADFILCLIIAICCSRLQGLLGCLVPVGLWLTRPRWISLPCGFLAHFPG